MASVIAPRETSTPTGHAGPAELLRLKSEYLIPCVYHFYRKPPQIVAAAGSHLIDHEGRRYLDCYTGVTVMSAGHGNRAIIEPAIEQIRRLQHTTTIYLTEPVLRLAEKLAAITPGALKRSFFCASGSEATEGAMLLAMLHTGRPEIAACANGLHGRTRWAMNATGLDLWRTDPFPVPGVHHVPFGDVDALRRLFERRGEGIAALIAEPIQGNGGINVPDDDYWPAVRRFCTQYGVLLILDEIQTGFNRTGRWFACEHWGITPDIMAVSKALGNGFPIAAFITTDEIAASYRRPGASTSGGNPVSAAAALATIAFHEKHDLARQADRCGSRIMTGLRDLACRCPSLFGPPRGRGLMLGLPVLNDDLTPSAARCDEMLEDLKDLGVLAGKTGPDRNILTLLPPLTISQEETGELLHALERMAETIG
jgi:4-aminobutyrate aminotransferase/4-aminobutyrate aminotransferase/(S)-3-amino-2-methylpropionate transaminase